MPENNSPGHEPANARAVIIRSLVADPRVAAIVHTLPPLPPRPTPADEFLRGYNEGSELIAAARADGTLDLVLAEGGTEPLIDRLREIRANLAIARIVADEMSARKAVPDPTSKPLTPARANPPAKNPLTPLVGISLRLRGNERRIITALHERGGRVPLADLAAICEWNAPYDGTWNSARVRLNLKLARQGYVLSTVSREAVIRPTRRTGK